MLWSPISGTRSAWCGLRQHGDASVVDAVTGQPFNQDCVQFLHDATAAGGSPQRFPGYVDQADQMLYRDIAMLPSQSLTVTFNYRTRMSTSIGTTPATRTGWFHGDPLAVVAGNFISSSGAGASAPQDSFMVYVGRPVNDAACVYSDGATRPVYDAQRRWFSEVIRAFGAGANYFEVFRTAGDNPADTLAATPSSGPIVVPGGDDQQRAGRRGGQRAAGVPLQDEPRLRRLRLTQLGLQLVHARRRTPGRHHDRHGRGAGRAGRLRDARTGWGERDRQPLPAA
jgi:hypothetical protein